MSYTCMSLPMIKRFATRQLMYNVHVHVYVLPLSHT